MRILVAYASQHGATAEIAERIAKVLTSAGHRSDLLGLPARVDVSGYEAFVVGSAVYMGHWRKEAMAFAREHWVALSEHPLWVFSSGPLGVRAADVKGRDLREVSLPKEAAALDEMVHPRAHRVFFGALDPHKLTPAQRTLRRFPSGRSLMVEGDFRDWAEVESWAKEIAGELVGEAVPKI